MRFQPTWRVPFTRRLKCNVCRKQLLDEFQRQADQIIFRSERQITVLWDTEKSRNLTKNELNSCIIEHFLKSFS